MDAPSQSNPQSPPQSPLPSPPLTEREKYRRAKKQNKHFWRALRYLLPYRWMVATSIFAAFFVGLAMTGGLGVMLPIIRVLINGDTVPAWIDRLIVQHRLGVTLADDPTLPTVRVVYAERKGRAFAAGIRDGDELLPNLKQGEALSALADPNASTIALLDHDHHPTTANLKPAPFYFLFARNLADRLPTNPVAAIAVVFGFLAGLSCVGNVLRFFQEYLSDKAAILAVNDMRRQMYDHVLHLRLGHFGEQGTSDVTSRLVQDAANLQDGFKTVLGQSIQEPIKAAMAFGLAMTLSWKLTLFILAFGPIMAIVIQKFGKKMRRASRKALQESSSMLGQLEGTLIGIRVVKAFGAERFERRRYSKIMRQLVAEQLRMSRIDAFSAPVLETITLLVAGCVVLYAAYLVLIARTLSADIFIMVMVSLMTIGESLRRCSKVNNALQKSNAAAARIFEVLDIPTETRRASGLADRAALLESEGPAASESTTRSATAKSAHPASTGSATGAVASGRFSGASASSMTTQSAVLSASSIAAPTSNGLPPSAATVLINLPSLQREIRFENITFSYPNTQQPALCGVSLAVTKGQSIAIVGGNGSGKTTLMALLPRFYDPGEGRVCIDGVDLATVTLRSLRRQISLVTQDSVIFPGTIAENIAYGDKLATPEAIEAAAKRAFAHEFILEKPQGYATPLGEMGGQLSGGQKQRICIARAILKQAPILILDEATSQVDAQSEHLIQRAIESVMHERTTFVIAHRFSTITRADSIVVMERGKIVGQGKHEELLRTCETYQKLYERQLFAA